MLGGQIGQDGPLDLTVAACQFNAILAQNIAESNLALGHNVARDTVASATHQTWTGLVLRTSTKQRDAQLSAFQRNRSAGNTTSV